jgi:ribosomal protein L17
VDKGKDMVGRVIISQKIASTAPKAGKPKPNQVSTAVEFLAPRAREGSTDRKRQAIFAWRRG